MMITKRYIRNKVTAVASATPEPHRLVIVASACVGLLLPQIGWAQDQESVVAERMWNTYMHICPLMLSDPEAYVGELQIPGPNGEQVVSQMADGNVVEFDTTIDGFTHTGLIVVIGKHQEIGCSMSTYSLGTPDLELTPERTHPMFDRRIREYDGIEVLGGLIDKEVPPVFEGHPVEKVNNYYQYWITGLVPDVDAVAQVILGDGVISFHMHRYLIGEEGT